MAIRNFNYSMAICPIFPKSDGDVPDFSKFMLHQINSKISINHDISMTLARDHPRPSHLSSPQRNITGDLCLAGHTLEAAIAEPLGGRRLPRRMGCHQRGEKLTVAGDVPDL